MTSSLLSFFYRCARGKRRAAVTFFACLAVYLVVLEVFLAVPVFNQDIQVRPASAVGPVMGLFFGWPGVLGAAAGNLVSDAIHYGSDPAELVIYFAIQVVYNALPYLVWYLVHGRGGRPFPRLDSAAKLATYLIIALVDSFVVAALLLPFEPDYLETLDINLVHALNNFVFLVYVGIPLLIALDLSPLEPACPRWVRATYARAGHMSLPQRLTLGFTVAMCATVTLFIIVSYGPLATMDVQIDFATMVAALYTQVTMLTLAAFIPLVGLLGWIERGVTRPLGALVCASRTFADELRERDEQGGPEGDATLPSLDKAAFARMHPVPEMSDLIDSTHTMRSELVDYVDRLAAATAERERASAELDIARSIQMGAVPHDFLTPAKNHDVLIEGFMRPAREVGGDFYDVFDAGNGQIAFVIGDVSGKGVPAALFMMRAQSLLHEQVMSCPDLGEALVEANNRLCERNDALLFVTAFVCVLSSQTGRVRYANAGHNPPVLLQGGVRSFLPMSHGLVLGCFAGVPFCEASFDLGMGDGLVLYTDGVTEATNTDRELFGNQRLLDLLARCDADGSALVAERIEAEVDAFAGTCPQADDITVLAFRRQATAGGTDQPA